MRLDGKASSIDVKRRPDCIIRHQPLGSQEAVDEHWFEAGPFAGVAWPMVAGMGHARICGVLRADVWNAGLAIAALLLAAAAVAVLWRRVKAGFLHRLLVAERERKAQEQEIDRLNRLYRALSQVNQAIVRTSGRPAILQAVCREMAQHGRFRLVWIGQHDEARHQVLPVAWAGEDHGFLDGIEVFTDDRAKAHGPTGTAVRDGRGTAYNDLMTDARVDPWHERMLQFGFHSGGAFPIRLHGRIWGSVTIYTPETGFFRDKEIALLEEVAGAIAFTLEHCEIEEENRRTEVALRESEARFRSLFENHHTIMFVIDPESGAIVDANPAAAAYYGWSREELVAKNIAAINTLSPEQIHAEMLAARETRRVHFSFKHRRADGSIRDVEVLSSPVNVTGRKLLYTLVFDVTDRRRADERIRRLNRTLALLSDINEAIVRERDVLALHREACRIAVEKGGFRMVWIGMLDPVTARVHPVAYAGAARDDIEKIEIDLGNGASAAGPTGAALRRGEHAICNDIEHDSMTVPWRAAAFDLGCRSFGSFPLKVGGRTVGAINLYSAEPGFFDDEELKLVDDLAMDLSFAIEHANAESERKGAEEKARHLAAFPELNPNPVFEFTGDGVLAYANPAAHALVSAAGVADLPALLPADTRQIVAECLAHGEPRLRLETQNGPRTLSWSFYPIASQGTVHCYAGDITERLQLEERFRQAQKMEAIGQLAGGVAHDFNNLLTVIQGHCGLLLLSATAADAEFKESAGEIQAAAIRAANLTRQLLTFSRRQPMQMRPLDLDDMVSNVGRMLQRLIGEDIVLHTRLLPGGAWVEGDSGMIEQVMFNLAVNARDAMPGSGELWLELESVALDATTARRHPAARPGSFICLIMRDNGCGIAPDHLPHIFEPFFTTKEVGKGTGLGLATVHGIVEQHHGWIEVDSHLRKGTTFRVHLPCLPGGAALLGGRSSASRVRGGDESILVVEDEPAVRMLAVRILKARGYRVQEAPSGAAALELWRGQAGAFDLLLTDLIMPGGVTGAQLAEQLRAEQPGLRVIYMSGYRGDTAGSGLNLHEGVNFLPKPFDAGQLATTVRTFLDTG